MFRPGVTPSFTTDDPTGANQTNTHSVDAVLYINGFQAATLADVDAALHPAGDAAERITFAFRDLMQILPMLTDDINGEHTIEVRTHGTGIGSDAAVVVYDTTEVPAGMIFNAPADVLEAVQKVD